MVKLSESHASAAYLEKNFGVKSQPISDEISKQLEEASKVANEKIRLNHSVYNQSNSRSNETIVCGKVLERIPNDEIKVINITEEQRERLCSELARLTVEFRQNKNVKCIYFVPCSSIDDVLRDYIAVTLVRNTNDNMKERIKQYNSLYQQSNTVQKFGLKIVLDTALEDDFTISDLDLEESRRSIDLMKSTILYDESGMFIDIKERVVHFYKESVELYNYYSNFAQILSPLEDELDNALDYFSTESDEEAYQEFTKSILFQDILDI